MRSRVVQDGGTTTYVVVMDPGDEAFSALTAFARDQRLRAAQLTAIGAFRRSVVGWYDRAAQDYRRNEIDEQAEVISMLGDVALSPEGEPTVHAHVVLALPDATALGGHLLEGHVWPTLEVVVRETPAALRKTMRPEVGLPLIDLPASES